MVPLIIFCLLPSPASRFVRNFELFNFNLYFYELKLVQFIVNEGEKVLRRGKEYLNGKPFKRRKRPKKYRFTLKIYSSFPIFPLRRIFYDFLFNFLPFFDGKLRLERNAFDGKETYKVGSCFTIPLFHSPQSENGKFLHENAINKQMDRNDHRTENSALSNKIPSK